MAASIAAPISDFLDGIVLVWVTKGPPPSTDGDDLKQKAVECGAVLLQHWDDSVTHIVIDAALADVLDWDDMLEHLGVEDVDDSIYIVAQAWLADCISLQRQVTSSTRRLRYKTLARDTRVVRRVYRNPSPQPPDDAPMETRLRWESRHASQRVYGESSTFEDPEMLTDTELSNSAADSAETDEEGGGGGGGGSDREINTVTEDGDQVSTDDESPVDGGNSGVVLDLEEPQVMHQSPSTMDHDVDNMSSVPTPSTSLASRPFQFGSRILEMTKARKSRLP